MKQILTAIICLSLFSCTIGVYDMRGTSKKDFKDQKQHQKAFEIKQQKEQQAIDSLNKAKDITPY